MNPETGGGGGQRKATYADLEAVPPHKVAELVDGKLYVSPRPAIPHARAKGQLFGELYDPFERGREGPGGWQFLMEVELHLGEDVLVPDVVGWRRERMPKMPDVVGFTLIPDWACEVLSEPTTQVDREKLKVYAREGLRHLWLVEPLRQELEVYGLEGGRWERRGTHSGQEQVRAEPFTSMLLELGVLWEW
jgi:Uma2 family endonuclease